MRGLRFDRLLSGAALALPLSVVLAIPPLSAQANAQTPAAIESAVPMPEGDDGGAADRVRCRRAVRDPGHR